MANIADKVAQIREATYGIEVRESIASGIEAINTEVESTTQRQTTLETDMADAKREAEEAAVRANTAAGDAEDITEALAVWEDYDSDADYIPMNKVIYQGSCYINIVACKGVLPTNQTNWLKIASKGDQGIPGPMPNIVVGNTTTLLPGNSASVVRRAGSPDSAPILDFEIPRGMDGQGTGDMVKADYDSNNDGTVDAADIAGTVLDNAITDAKLSDAAGQIKARFTSHLADYVSIRRFGAVGDGITDDTQAIKDAIAYIKSTHSSGGKIFIPRGTYIITDTITIDANISITGEGSNGSDPDSYAAIYAISKIKWGSDDTTKIMFDITGLRGGISWSDFYIDGYYDSTHKAATGISIDRLICSTFSNIIVGSCGHGALLKPNSDVANDGISYNIFNGVGFWRCGIGITLSDNDAHNANVCHNTFTNLVADYTGDYGVHLIGCDNNAFIMCRIFKRSGVGIGIQCEQRAQNNYFYHIQAHSFLAKSGSTNVIWGFDRGNGQPQPIVEAGAYLTWTEDGDNSRLWTIENPIQQNTISTSGALKVIGRTIKYSYSTTANFVASTAQLLNVAGAPTGITGITCPLATMPFAIGITLSGYLAAGSLLIEIKDASTVVWSNTVTYPSGNNRFFHFSKNAVLGENSLSPGHVLTVNITPSADIAPGTLQACVDVICAI